MNFSTIALIAFLSSSSSQVCSAFFVTGPSAPSLRPAVTSKLRMISPNDGANVSERYVVTFNAGSSNGHSEEINLESMTNSQLKQFHDDLESLNLICTEEGKQTDPLCDVALKDERDHAMMQIQSLIVEREKDKLKNEVDMDAVRSMIQTPWIHSFSRIESMIRRMEALNCECTEEGNQTKVACDIVLKDERDAAIETLNLYMTSVRNQVLNQEQRNNVIKSKKNKESRNRNTTTAKSSIKKNKMDVVSTVAAVVDVDSTFGMDEIRDCVNNPGSKSIEVMTSMQTYLETKQMMCTEEGTQTNAECDIEVKAERDYLMERLASQITDVKLCLNEIKAFVANDDNIDQLAIDDVMNTVINTIPNLPTNGAAVKNNNKVVASSGGASSVRRSSVGPGSSDEFLVQI